MTWNIFYKNDFKKSLRRKKVLKKSKLKILTEFKTENEARKKHKKVKNE